jgi:modulator of FtsH protease HflK
MPWNNQGGGNGGPWGSPPGGDGQGGNNPWGRPPGGPPGGKGPDFDNLVRKGQDRLRQWGGGGRSMIWVVLAAAALWGLSGIYRVESDEQGVVMRFGQYNRTEQSGLHYRLPAPIETVLTPKVTRVNRLEIGYRSAGDGRRGGDVADESLMLTGDENIIDIDFTVFWVIKDAGHYLFKIRDPEQTVKKAAESAMREVIGRTDIQPALTEARQDIEQQTKALLQQMLDEYQSGIEISQIQLQKVDPPTAVVDAFNDVQRARQDRERLRNEAEAYRNDIIPRARGDAEQLLQQAQAYREQVVNLAKGDAQRFQSVQQAYQAAPEVTARRMYLETMQEVLGGARKVILDQPKGGGGAVPYLPLNELTDALRKQPPAAPVPAASATRP